MVFIAVFLYSAVPILKNCFMLSVRIYRVVDVHGNFGEDERRVRVARGVA